MAISLASGGMVVSCSMAVSNGPTLAGPLPAITPNSAAWPRSVLISSVRPLANQAFAHLQNHALSLLRDRLRRHEMHARSPRRLADRLGIIAVILATFDVGFDIWGRDQTYHVAERDQFAGPIMSAATGFQGDLGAGKLRKEGDQLRAAEIDPQHRPILLIDAV